ncbi:MAG: chemotaxis protein CheW [Cellvibrionales bacterium]|nr:chemotaxis protein CheW [Cellvibrionales bacterium]
MSETAAPFDLLQQLAERVHTDALPLPERAQADDSWRALACELGQSALLVAMESVAEVTHPPATTRLPGVKPWVRGIANVQGEILAVVDLHRFFALPDAPNPRTVRMLVITQGEVRMGLLVDRVLGIRQVATHQVRDQTTESGAAALAPCLAGAALVENTWTDIFDPARLIASPAFNQVTRH